jgi:hypothetical protein
MEKEHLPHPLALASCDLIGATTKHIMKMKGDEKNRRSNGGNECHFILRGKKVLGNGSFQVHVSLQWIVAKLLYP